MRLIHNSTTLATWKDREEPEAALKPVYQAVNADPAEAALDGFAAGPRGTRIPTVAAMWRHRPPTLCELAYPRQCTPLYRTMARRSYQERSAVCGS